MKINGFVIWLFLLIVYFHALRVSSVISKQNAFDYEMIHFMQNVLSRCIIAVIIIVILLLL